MNFTAWQKKYSLSRIDNFFNRIISCAHARFLMACLFLDKQANKENPARTIATEGAMEKFTHALSLITDTKRVRLACCCVLAFETDCYRR